MVHREQLRCVNDVIPLVPKHTGGWHLDIHPQPERVMTNKQFSTIAHEIVRKSRLAEAEPALLHRESARHGRLRISLPSRNKRKNA